MSPRRRRRPAGRRRGSGWHAYVPVAERRRRAARKLSTMRESGREVTPVTITGRRIATTFWGEAWCRNLESYSDYSNRLPRGRTYVRNGAVIDLAIAPGRVRAMVSGTRVYRVEIEVGPIAERRWLAIQESCAGGIDSLVELLSGSISRSVMEVVTRKGEGLFPAPREIGMRCSCPDWAAMCKHVAAALYGVGARLDHAPELLFELRGVDPVELIEAAVTRPPSESAPRRSRVLKPDELSSVFGIDLDIAEPNGASASDDATDGLRTRRAKHRKAAKKKPTTKRPAKKTVRTGRARKK